MDLILTAFQDVEMKSNYNSTWNIWSLNKYISRPIYAASQAVKYLSKHILEKLNAYTY